MRIACSFIEHHRKRGSGVYIHCKSGRGRSAAIAMAWLLQVKKLTPLAANRHLLRVRKVRARLFLQKNVIQFYEELREAKDTTPATDESESLGGERTISFSPWVTHTRRNSNQTGTINARGILQGAGQALRTFSFRSGGAASGATGSSERYGYNASPPDWDNPIGGVWEMNVAPLAPTIPEDLPPWAEREQQMFNDNALELSHKAGSPIGQYARPTAPLGDTANGGGSSYAQGLYTCTPAAFSAAPRLPQRSTAVEDPQHRPPQFVSAQL